MSSNDVMRKLDFFLSVGYNPEGRLTINIKKYAKSINC